MAIVPKASADERSEKRAVAWQLALFFGGVFLIPWGTAGVLLSEPEFLVRRYGPVDLNTPAYAIMFFACVWVPSLLGFILTAVFDGKEGIRNLTQRILRWRVGWWLPSIVFGIPLYYAATDWILYEQLNWPTGEPHYRLYLYGWIIAFFTGAILLDPGPVGEEVGWRGFAFPRLLYVMPFWGAELTLGSIWGFWHVPAFYLASSGQSTLDMGGFMVGAVLLSFAMGGAYVATGGSVLLAGFMIHFFANQLPDLEVKIWVEVVRFGILAAAIYPLSRLFPSHSAAVPFIYGQPVESPNDNNRDGGGM